MPRATMTGEVMVTRVSLLVGVLPVREPVRVLAQRAKSEYEGRRRDARLSSVLVGINVTAARLSPASPHHLVVALPVPSGVMSVLL